LFATHICLLLRGGHAAISVVSVALISSQHQHCALTLSLHPPINVEHKAGQCAETVFQVFSKTQQGFECTLSALVEWA